MDGFAVRAEDTQGASPERPSVLHVLGQVRAGQLPEQTVLPGTAVRLMTGAPMPPGADSVVPFEDTDQGPVRGTAVPETVRIYRPVAPGAFVRRSGEDVQPGETVLEKGRVIGPAEIGLLASLGYERVPVVRRPRVAVLSTGDELTPPGRPLTPGKIYDANTFSVAAAIKACGCTPVVLGPAADDPQQLRECLRAALQADAVVTTAGVSMGDSDWVRSIVEEMGSLEFWQIRMRPGRPLAFGHLRGPDRLIPFFGLPGNPVSALVTFQLFVHPALFKMMGYAAQPSSTVTARLEETVRNEDGRQFYARVTLRRGDQGGLLARLTGHQGSHVLTSLTRAHGLAVIPEGCTEMPAGSEVQVLLLREFTVSDVVVEEARYR